MPQTTRIAAAVALGFSTAGPALSASQIAGASEPHDGTWSVQMVTDSGICSARYTYAIAIEDGAVRYLPAPGDSPTTVSGRVGADGAVDIDIHRSVAKVDALGRLTNGKGSGTWSLGMLGCQGRWSAQRRTTTAQR
jgi:hypothetical protein